MKRYLLAHDLGTTGNKATLFSEDGEMHKSAVVDYPVNFFNGNWAEQSPHDWWNAVCTATKKLLADIQPSDVYAVSFSGQMMGCLCVDKDGTPLRDSIIWADMRAAKQEEALSEAIEPERLYRLAGHKLSRSYSLEKLMWIRDNEPEVYEKTHKMLNAKDYIIQKLTGEFLTDYSDASGTNALDLNTMQWSDEIINAAGLDISLFPQIKPSTHLVGVVSQSIADECGLAPGTKIVLGGGDGSCASVGAGSIAEGITYNCLGSSSWISTVSKKPYYDEQMRTVTWAHVIPDLLIPSGTMQTAGAAFGWAAERMYKEELAKDKDAAYALINEDVANASAGSNALLFLPYLLGERCPRWNGNARGSFVGLKMEHTRGDMIRSVMEGVAMNLNIILGILKKAVDINEMLVVGGLAQGDTNQQILSDIYGMDIARLKHLEEATSIGAAVIAGVGSGVLPGFDSANVFNSIHSRKQPIASNKKVYYKMQELFDITYKSQLAILDELARI